MIGRIAVQPALLLVVLLTSSCGPPSQPRGRQEPGDPLFVEASSESGLDFYHFTGSTGEYFMPEIMGAGVALLDYDGDGDLDAYFLQGAMLDPSKPIADAWFPPPPGNWPSNQLFRNELVPTGKLQFTNVTEEANVGHEGYGMGAAVGDYDDDGDPDLFVTNFGPNVLYRNNGDGTFADATSQGIDDDRWSTSAAFLDYDNDADLDLIFTNYIDFTIRNNKQCFDPTGARDYCTPNVYRPAPDKLFRNDGGRFTDVSVEAGLGAAFGNGLGVVGADFDGDGWIDIFVSNDGVANQLWRNNGAGGFEDDSLMAGAAYNADGLAEAGMGVTAGDLDRDGDEDLFMTHLARETNTLYVNNGRGQFRDETNRYGLGAASIPFTGFGARWFDYNNDGFEDLFVANGAVTIMESQRSSDYPFRQTNQLFQGGPQGFEEISENAGPPFALLEVSRGAAFGDIDNDGDIDILISNNNGPARLLLNQSDGGRWLRLQLLTAAGHPDVVGARVALLHSSTPQRWSRAHTDGSYLSASEPTVHFGLRSADEFDAIGVAWPNGEWEIFRNVAANQLARLRQGDGEAAERPARGDRR